MIMVNYTKPFTNNVERDVNDVRASYLRDLEKLREYYGDLFAQATFNGSRPKLRRIV